MSTDYVLPALELIAARRYRVDPKTGYTRTVMDTNADNAANTGIIISDNRFKPEEIDMRWTGSILYRNDIIEETALSVAVLDHPVNGTAGLPSALPLTASA